MSDCKGIKILLAICPSNRRDEDFLPQLQVFWNLRLSHMSFLLSLFVRCPEFQHAGLLVTSPALGFLHVQLPPWKLSPSWVSAVLGLCPTGAKLRLFQPG